MAISSQFKKELEKVLLEEKKKLESELNRFAKKDAKLAGDYDTVFPIFDTERRQDQDENADEVEEYDKLLAVEHALELRLQEVNQALARIGTTDFGICENCGEEIPRERLKANPAATTCLKCKAKS